MTTIVSAFLSNVNTRSDADQNSYLAMGKRLLDIKSPKIIFFDEKYIDDIEYDPKYTVIIPFKKNDIYLYEYIDEITEFNVITDFPAKDSLEFMILMCFKTELVRKAIHLNPFNTDQFTWVDFRINHVFKYVHNENFEKYILDMTKNKYSSVRMATIIDPNKVQLQTDIYRNIVWYFAGGVFGGNSCKLIQFADLVKKKCISVIHDKKSLMWEVNIWYLVFQENKHLFDLFFCNHNESLITNY